MTTEITQHTPQFNEPQSPSHLNAGTVHIESQRAIAEARAKLLLAKQFPRDENAIYSNVIKSCSRPALAQVAMYAYPRGGQQVTGPSIRLAEELARCYGNIEFGIRELSQKQGESEMEAFCWDLESNVISSQRFAVKHIRESKTGVKNLVDSRDIYEKTANDGSRRLRARILAVIPPEIVEAAIQQCRLTLAGKSDIPVADRVKSMVVQFSKFGITQKHIEVKLNKKLSDLLIDDLIDLATIYNSIKDGQHKPSEYFNMTETSVQNLNEKLKEEAQNPNP